MPNSDDAVGLRLGGVICQRDSVHAVPSVRRTWELLALENVTEMAAAIAAHNLDASAVGIRPLLDSAGDTLVESGPAAPGVELGACMVESSTARSAAVGAVSRKLGRMLLLERPLEFALGVLREAGWLGGALAENGELVLTELVAPVRLWGEDQKAADGGRTWSLYEKRWVGAQGGCAAFCSTRKTGMSSAARARSGAFMERRAQGCEVCGGGLNAAHGLSASAAVSIVRAERQSSGRAEQWLCASLMSRSHANALPQLLRVCPLASCGTAHIIRGIRLAAPLLATHLWHLVRGVHLCDRPQGWEASRYKTVILILWVNTQYEYVVVTQTFVTTLPYPKPIFHLERAGCHSPCEKITGPGGWPGTVGHDH